MRIIAGRMKGRKLLTPTNDKIRPTSDRLRESIFNLLMHGSYGGEHIIDRRVMDLCCGTGALGFEAISRGASECIFVDQDKSSLALAKDNAMHCQVIPSCQFLLADVARLPAVRAPVALVLMDAPYDRPLTLPAYTALCNGNWFEEGALFVIEQSKTSATEQLPGAEIIDERNYGKAQIVIYRC